MKTGIISLLLIIPFLMGCDDENCPPCSTPTDDRTTFEMNFLEYSDNNYFINDIYTDTSAGLNIFNQYYGNFPPIVNVQYSVKEIEVYKSTNTIGQSVIIGCAYIDLPARSPSDIYPDSLRDFQTFVPIAGQATAGRFRLLNMGNDYLFNSATGQLSFLYPLNEQEIVAVAYRIVLGDSIYGEFFSDLIHNSDTVAVLKLVKPKNLQPQYRKAWKLKMRNIYTLIPNLGEVTDIDLDIYLIRADGSTTNSINNKRLLELFGFDKFNESGGLMPDGKFDNLPGYTYERRTSEIIFPVIEPFGDNIPTELSEYKYDRIYDTTKTYLFLPENYFVIKGKYRPVY